MRILLALTLFLAACNNGPHPPLEDLRKIETFPQFKVQSIRGVRDGDRLHVQAMISDSSSILTVQMDFAVGSPTTLQSGRWQWNRNGQAQTGSVAERSTTFLGGQDGPPSIGGTFDLLDPAGTALYRIHLPTTPVRPPA